MVNCFCPTFYPVRYTVRKVVIFLYKSITAAHTV